MKYLIILMILFNLNDGFDISEVERIRLKKNKVGQLVELLITNNREFNVTCSSCYFKMKEVKKAILQAGSMEFISITPLNSVTLEFKIDFRYNDYPADKFVRNLLFKGYEKPCIFDTDSTNCAVPRGQYFHCFTPVNEYDENFKYSCDKIEFMGSFVNLYRYLKTFSAITYERTHLIVKLNTDFDEPINVTYEYDKNIRSLMIESNCFFKPKQTDYHRCLILPKLFPFTRYSIQLTISGKGGYGMLEFITSQGKSNEYICFADCKNDNGDYFGLQHTPKYCYDTVDKEKMVCAKNKNYHRYTKIKVDIELLPKRDVMGVGILLYLGKGISQCYYTIKEPLSNMDSDIQAMLKCSGITKKKISPKLKLSMEFKELIMGEHYIIYIITIIDRKSTGFITQLNYVLHTYHNENLPSCFMDCAVSGKYYGLRASTKTKKICIMWKKKYPQGLKIANRCYATIGKYKCYPDMFKSEECSIPDCNNMSEDSQFCVHLNPDQERCKMTNDLVSGTWTLSKRTNIVGYVVLAENIVDGCVAAVVYGQKKLTEYAEDIRNLILSCKNKKHQQKISNQYQITITNKFKDHYVYIFATLSNSKMSKIRRITCPSAKQKKCFEDCYDGNIYAGIQGFNRYYQCGYKNVRPGKWCHSSAQNPPHCYNSLTLWYKCIMPKCSKKEYHCVAPVTIQSGINEIAVSWIEPMVIKPVDAYVFMIFNAEHDCEQAIYVGTITSIILNSRIKTHITKACKKQNIEKELNYTIKIANLHLSKVYHLYSAVIIPSGKIGLVGNITVSLAKQCFYDCSVSTKQYFGIRSHVSGFVLSGNTQQKFETKVIHSCSITFNVERVCVFNLKVKSFTHYTEVTWKKARLFYIGYIILLYSDGKCIDSVVLGEKKPHDYVSATRSFYMYCKKYSHSIPINFNYKFKGLLQNKKHRIYILETYSSEKISQTTFVDFSTIDNKNSCYYDCHDTEDTYYFGYRHLAKDGSVCKNWAKVKSSHFNSYKSNYCRSNNPFCYKVKGSYDYCDIPKCATDKGVQCSDIDIINTGFSSIMLNWTRPRTYKSSKYSMPTRFLILLNRKRNGIEFCAASAMVAYYKSMPNKYWRLKTNIQFYSLFGSCKKAYDAYENMSTAFSFTELKRSVEYTIRIVAVLDIDSYSYINIINKIKIEDCFYDCRLGKYYTGLRSATKFGQKCDIWSKYKKYRYRRSNLCYPDKEVTQCLYSSNQEECAVPSCDEIPKTDFCNMNLQQKSTYHTIEGSWKNQSKTNFLGFVALLFNENHQCEQVIIYGKIKPADYQIQIRSFYISCLYNQTYSKKITYAYKFVNLLTGRYYTVYLFATLSFKDISRIQTIYFETKLLGHCFRDCDDGSKYNGERINKVPKCTNRLRNGLFCYNVNYIMFKNYMGISWSNPDIKNIYPQQDTMIKVYDGDKCITSIYYYANKKVSPHITKKYIDNCADKSVFKSNNSSVTLKVLNFNTSYRISIWSIINESYPGYINKQTQMTPDCFTDCTDLVRIYMFRSATVNGERCMPWRFTNESHTPGNLCSSKGQCRISDGSLDDCPYRLCDYKLEWEPCVNVSSKTDVDYHSITGKWTKGKSKKSMIGYVVLLHNERDECEKALVYGTKRPADYNIIVKSYFISCNETFHYIKITYNYTFKNLLTNRHYRVYIFGTFSLENTTNIKVLYYKTKRLSYCHEDCQKNKFYNGTRTADEYNRKCLATKGPLGTHHLCVIVRQNDRPLCYYSKLYYRWCNVQICEETHADMFCPEVTHRLSDYNSLIFNWTNPDVGKQVNTYILVLFDVTNITKCQQGIVIGKNYTPEMENQVTNVYLGCEFIKEIDYFSLGYEFRDMRPKKNYEVHITGVLNKTNIGLINKKTNFTIKKDLGHLEDCFTDCYKENYYFGLRSSTKTGFVCGYWKDDFRGKAEELRYSNRCYANGPKVECSTSRNKTSECDIPKCEDIKKDNKFCVRAKLGENKGYYIKGTWEKEIADKSHFGFVVLLHDKNDKCIQFSLYKNEKTSSYDPIVTSLWKTCGSNQIKQKMYEYRFGKLVFPQKRTVYIITILKPNVISNVKTIRYGEKFASYCYSECNSGFKYNGVQRKSKYGTCVLHKGNQFCYPKRYSQEVKLVCNYRDLLARISEVQCNAPKCNDVQGVYCVKAKILYSDESSALIGFTKPYITNNAHVDSYLILLQQKKKPLECDIFIIVGKIRNYTTRSMDFLPCLRVEFQKSEHEVLIDKLKKRTKYQVFIMPLVGDDKIGYVNKEIIIETDCFHDCFVKFKNGTYRNYHGVRSLTKRAQKCVPWIQNADPKYQNLLYSFCRNTDAGVACTNIYNKTELCYSDNCNVDYYDQKKCVEVNSKLISTPDIIQGSFVLKENKNLTGYIINMLNDYGECERSLLLDIKSSQQSPENRALFNSCGSILHRKNKNNIYKFKDVYPDRLYKVYVTPVFLSGYIGPTKVIYHQTSRPNYCFKECHTKDFYDGIKSGRDGKPCISSSGKKHQLRYKWCTIKSSTAPWCYTKEGYQFCNIDLCKDYQTNVRCVMAEFYKTRKNTIYFVWTKPYTTRKNTKIFGYLILLYETGSTMKCRHAIIVGKYKYNTLGYNLSDYFISCDKKINYKDTFSIEFNDLVVKKQYQIHIAAITSQKSFGYVNRRTKFTYYPGYRSCKIALKNYSGLQSHSGCGLWKDHPNPAYHNRTFNLCYSEGSDVFCYNNTKKFKCTIDSCNQQSKIQITSYFTLNNVISETKININLKHHGTLYGGYMYAFYDMTNTCIRSRLYHYKDYKKYSLNIKQHVYNCKDFKNITKRSIKPIKINSLLTSREYTIFVIPIVSVKEVGRVTEYKFKTKKFKHCIEDCIRNKKYNGKRNANKNGEPCVTYQGRYFSNNERSCIHKGHTTAWCYTKTRYIECKIPTCDKTQEDIHCLFVSYNLTDYMSVKVNWLNPDSKSNVLAYMIFLYSWEGKENLCQEALIFGKKDKAGIGNDLDNFYIGCHYHRFESKYRLSYEFYDLFPYKKYEVYVVSVVKKNKVGFLNVKTKFKIKKDLANLPNCFEDCFKDNNYHGLRSASSTGKRCSSWKLASNGSRKQYRISNRCYANVNKAYCMVNNVTEDCLIPSCQSLDKRYKLCVASKIINISSRIIAGRWFQPRNNTIGYVVMLNNEKQDCEQCIVYGKIKPKDYDLMIRNFYISCKKISHMHNITFEYEFSNIQAPQVYSVYIFATFTLSETSNVLRINYTVPLPDTCFNDCYSKSRYKGIRMMTEYKEECNYHDSKRWCRNSGNEKPWCISKKSGNVKTDCLIPNCSESQGVYCMGIKALLITDSRISIKVTDIFLKREVNITGYVVLLYEIDTNYKCKYAFIFKTSFTLQKSNVTSLYEYCDTKMENKSINSIITFDKLTENVDVRIYVAGIIDNKFIGHVKQTNFDRDCLTDCIYLNRYVGIRRISKSGDKCLIWNLSSTDNKIRTRIANKCVRNKKKYICNTAMDKSEDCLLPECKFFRTRADFCLKIKKNMRRANSIGGKVLTKFTTILNYLGYVIVLHDQNEKCLKSIIYGKLQPDEYDKYIQGFYKSCDKVTHLQTLKFTYQFNGLISARRYAVYTFATLNFNETSKIRRTYHITASFDYCFQDCVKNKKYSGIRMVTKNGNICKSYSKIYKITHNWCHDKHVNYIWCYIKNKTQEKCDIPTCLSTGLYCVIANNMQTIDYSLVVQWKQHKMRETVAKDYLVMLYEKIDLPICKTAIVSGNYMTKDLHHYVTDLYNGCEDINEISTSQLDEYKFVNLKPNTTYQVYISEIMNKYNVSYINKQVLVQSDCFTDCQLDDKYLGLRSGTKNGSKCLSWSNAQNSLYSDRIENYCYSDNDISVCLVQSDELRECPVPFCNTIDKELEFCPVLMQNTIEANSISGKWKYNTLTSLIGSIVLIHDNLQHCLEAQISGDTKPDEYDMAVRSFYISCDKTNYTTLISNKYKFENLKPYRNYEVYIIGIVSNSSVSKIKRMKYQTKLHEYCFIDCLDQESYSGIRMMSVNDKKCLNYEESARHNRSHWCIFDNRPEPWCFIKKGSFDNCSIPACDEIQKNVLCAEVEGIQTIKNSLLVKWDKLDTRDNSIIREFLVLLYETNVYKKCRIALITGNANAQFLSKNVTDFYKGCHNIVYVKETIMMYEFRNLQPNYLYEVYVTAIINRNSVGYINKNVKLKTSDCLEDCQHMNVLPGLRSATKTGKKCLPWKENYAKEPFKSRISNLCYTSSNKSHCATGKNTMEECAVPECEETPINCVNVALSDPKDKTIGGTWKNIKDVKSFPTGYIVLLYNRQDKCISSRIYGVTAPNDYGKYVKGLFSSCDDQQYNKTITKKYEFTNLKYFEVYKVYLFATISPNKISKIKIIHQQPKLPNYCFNDCTKNKYYSGMQMLAEKNKTCAYFKDLSPTKYNEIYHNRCFQNGTQNNPWCYLEGKKIEFCDIIDCKYTEKDVKCAEVTNVKQDKNSVEIEWKKPDAPGLHSVTGYIVLLYKLGTKHICLEAVVFGEFDKTSQFKHVTNFFIGCSKIDYKNIQLSHKFKRLDVLTEYQFIVIPIVDYTTVGFVNNRSKVLIKTADNCLGQCESNKKNVGLKFYEGHSVDCSEITKSVNCVSSKYKAKPKLRISGSYAEREDIKKAGFVILLYGLKQCYKAILHGKFEGLDVNTDKTITPFYSNCTSSKKVKQMDYKFEFAIPDRFDYYTVFIVPIIKKGSYGFVSQLVILPLTSDQCSAHCYQGRKYVGNLKFYKGYIGYCTSVTKTVNCVSSSYVMKYITTVEVSFTDTKPTDKKMGFIILLYGVTKCYSAVLQRSISDDKIMSIELIKGFYEKCDQIVNKTVNSNIKFDLPDLYDYYTVHIVPIVNKTSFGYVSKLDILPSTTDTCFAHCNDGKTKSKLKYYEQKISDCQNINKETNCVPYEFKVTPDLFIVGNFTDRDKSRSKVGFIISFYGSKRCQYSLIYGKLKKVNVKNNPLIGGFFDKCMFNKKIEKIDYKFKFKLPFHYDTYFINIITIVNATSYGYVSQITIPPRYTDNCFAHCKKGGVNKGLRFYNGPIPSCTTINRKINCAKALYQITPTLKIIGRFSEYEPEIKKAGFIALLHGSKECYAANIIGSFSSFNVKNNKMTKAFYSNCSTVTKITSKNNTFEFNIPTKLENYNLYIVPIIDAKNYGLVSKNEISPKSTKSCFAHCANNDQFDGGLNFYKGTKVHCNKIIEDAKCVTITYSIKENHIIAGNFFDIDSMIKKKGFIVLLYGNVECHGALIYGSYEKSKGKHDPIIRGFYEECALVTKQKIVDDEFQFKMPVKYDKYLIFIIPIVNETSYGYISRLNITTNYSIPKIEYILTAFHVITLLIIIAIGIAQNWVDLGKDPEEEINKELQALIFSESEEFPIFGTKPKAPFSMSEATDQIFDKNKVPFTMSDATDLQTGVKT